VLSSRRIDSEGYVATHQHASIAHQDGWPFPFWAQSKGTWGWHFSLQGVPGGWHGTRERDEKPWKVEGAESGGIKDHAWNLVVRSPEVFITSPEFSIDTFCAPFVQIRWRTRALEGARVFLRWRSKGEKGFPERKRFAVPLGAPSSGIPETAAGRPVVKIMLPLHRHPEWKGEVSQFRLCVYGARRGAELGLQAVFTQFDTRHSVNNQAFLLGCDYYFSWTGDLEFLRRNIDRMRLALRYDLDVFGGKRNGYLLVDFPGHDGRAGYDVLPDGRKKFHYGHGIGSNYWDLLPFGGKDAYATMLFYRALLRMARLEEAVIDHPKWNIPGGVLRLDPSELRATARKVKEVFNRLFWNPETGRFVACIDADGTAHDYGYTFLNLEAIYYGVADTAHSQAILDWIEGKRIVAGDTSTGEDIYRFRFGPRATTRRNVEWYMWAWPGPERIPFGGQVQDGGAVFGFSYHDLAARLKVRGPDNAWRRLREILRWYEEVRAAGGYRAYYADGKKGTLQGGGRAGGLGLDREFIESVLVPQVMLYGFLGFTPRPDGFSLRPSLPSAWPSLRIGPIRYRGLVLDIEAARGRIVIRYEGLELEPTLVFLPEGEWSCRIQENGGGAVRVRKSSGNVFVLEWGREGTAAFERRGGK